VLQSAVFGRIAAIAVCLVYDGSSTLGTLSVNVNY